MILSISASQVARITGLNISKIKQLQGIMKSYLELKNNLKQLKVIKIVANICQMPFISQFLFQDLCKY
jgi:hypothetical protein